MFENFRGQIEIFECTFDIEIDGTTKKNRIQAPRIAIEQQFLSLVQQAANSSQAIKIKMSRIVPVYDNFDKKWINRENSVTFANNAYIKIKGENFC